MSSRLLVVMVATFLSLTFGLAPAAQARRFSVTGGGAELHIGNGLALPIQAGATVAGTVFPPLLIPVKAGPAPIISGTVAKPLKTFMATSMHAAKQGYQRKLVLPVGVKVLSKPAALKTVGVLASNPKVFAVATNLKYTWPAAPANPVFSTGQVGPVTVNAFGGTMTYSNKLGTRFGGAAQFAISPGAEPAGLFSPSPITVYLKINAATPPCTQMLTPPAQAACHVGFLIGAPTGLAAAGAKTTMTVATPGSPITGLNEAAVKLGATPKGTVLAGVGTVHTAGSMTFGPAAMPFLYAMIGLPTNMANSQGAPWTTGAILISQKAAAGAVEMFTIEGKDARTANGGGTIQMVSGALSSRPASGPNGNRGWLRLTLAPLVPVPSMSWVGLSATAGLLILGFGYAMRRRMFAQN